MKKGIQVVELDGKVMLVDREFGEGDVCTIRQLFTDYGIDLYLLVEEDDRDSSVNDSGYCGAPAHKTNYGYLKPCE